MRTLRLVVPLLALTTATLGAMTQVTEGNRILAHFRRRDLTALQNLPQSTVERLSAGERNAVALAAAAALTPEPYLRGLDRKPIHEVLTQATAEDSLAEAEFRRQWGINVRAAEMLRDLAEKRLITDPQVLPSLIAGLDHPEREWVGRECFYALQHLNRRSSGEVYWARGVWDEEKHREISRWWRKWWEANRARHPIFDPELERVAREEVLGRCRVIETLRPAFPELGAFDSPDDLPLRWQIPLFYVEYNPGAGAALGNLFLPADQLPWMAVSCRFGSPDLPAHWSDEASLRPPGRLHRLMKTCYTGRIQGTDLLVEVQVASKNPRLAGAMEKALKQ